MVAPELGIAEAKLPAEVKRQGVITKKKSPSTRSNVITAGLHVRSIGWMLGNRIILGPIMTTIQEAGGQM